MTVVMAIIAIISLIGVGGFLGIRRQSLVDAAADALLSDIRESQNKAISIVTDSTGQNIKVWGIGRFNNTNHTYDLIGLYPLGTTQLTVPPLNTYEKRTNVSPYITLKTTFSDGSVTSELAPDGGYIAYSAPFGTSYLAKEIYYGGGSAGCYWQTNATRVAQDYFLDATACSSNYAAANHNAKGEIRVTLTYDNSNISKTVVVKSNGDAYIE